MILDHGLKKEKEDCSVEKLAAGGYAYPYIEPSLLEKALVLLEELLVFSCGFTFEGNLILPSGDDRRMIQMAEKNNVKPVLVLTPFSKGAFHNQLVRVILENRLIQDRIIAQLAVLAEEQGFRGVDIDFENVLPADRVRYAEFVGRVRERLGEKGCSVSVAAAPKVSDSQKGLAVEGTDYALLGESADRVFLKTYEWGYAYGPPMAVSPLDKVRQVVEYAVTKIPAEKLILGIPNYGYDWTLPYERGITRARLVGSREAEETAEENGAVIRHAEIAQSPWFTYVKGGAEHAVWFEDARSIAAKWNLAREFGLAGVRFWNLMQEFPKGLSLPREGRRSASGNG